MTRPRPHSGDQWSQDSSPLVCSTINVRELTLWASLHLIWARTSAFQKALLHLR